MAAAFFRNRDAMPKELHRRLTKQANKLGLTGERKNAYVYGTMNRIEKGGERKTLRDKLKQR